MTWLWRVFVVALLALPIALGGYRPLGWSAMGVVVAGLLFAWLGLVGRGRTRLFWRSALWPSLALFVGVVAWILVQALWPVGDGLAHPLWRMAGDVLGVPLSGRISAAPQAGLVRLMRLLTAAGCFWLAVQGGRDPARANLLLGWFGIAAIGYALYGLVGFSAGNGWLLWYPRWAYPHDLTSTFVNRNSYATFAGLGLIVLTALFLEAFRARWRETEPGLSAIGRRVAAMSGRPMLYLTGALIVAMALLQTHSRMGLVATMAGLIVVMALMQMAGRLRGYAPLLAIAAAALALVTISGGGTLDRLAENSDSNRPELWALAENGIASSPWLGSGYGSFAGINPMFRTLALPAPVTYLQAHNSYLEMAFELGIPTAIALMVAIAWPILLSGWGFMRRERDRHIPGIAVAAAVLVGLHAWFDFSAQIPGVGYLFAALIGIGVAQSFSTRPLVGREAV